MTEPRDDLVRMLAESQTVINPELLADDLLAAYPQLAATESVDEWGYRWGDLVHNTHYESLARRYSRPVRRTVYATPWEDA